MACDGHAMSSAAGGAASYPFFSVCQAVPVHSYVDSAVIQHLVYTLGQQASAIKVLVENSQLPSSPKPVECFCGTWCWPRTGTMAAQSTVAAGSEFPSVVPCSAAACGAASVAQGPFPEQPGGAPYDLQEEGEGAQREQMHAESSQHAEMAAAEVLVPRPGNGRGGARRTGGGRGGVRRSGSAPCHRQPRLQPAASAAPAADIAAFPSSHCVSIAKCPQYNVGKVDCTRKVVSESVGAVGVHSCRPARAAGTPITNRYAPLAVQCDLADDEGVLEAESLQHAELAAAAVRALQPGAGRGGARRVGDGRGGVRGDGSAPCHRQPRSQLAASPAPPAVSAANRSSHSVNNDKWPQRDPGEVECKGKGDSSTTASSAGSEESDDAMGIVGRMCGAVDASAFSDQPGVSGAFCNDGVTGSGATACGHGAPAFEAVTGVDADACSEASSACTRDEIAELMSLLCLIMRGPVEVRESLSGHVTLLEDRLRRLGALSEDVC